MKNEVNKYQVVIKNILPGNPPDVTLKHLAQLFKTKPSRFNSLIEGKGLIVAKNIDSKKATKYKLSIEKTGCRVSIQAFKKNKLLKKDIKIIQCHKCGTKQPFTDECIHCGVMIQKHLSNKQKQKDGQKGKIPEISSQQTVTPRPAKRSSENRHCKSASAPSIYRPSKPKLFSKLMRGLFILFLSLISILPFLSTFSPHILLPFAFMLLLFWFWIVTRFYKKWGKPISFDEKAQDRGSLIRYSLIGKPISFDEKAPFIPSSTFMPILKSYMKIINHKTIFIYPNIPKGKLKLFRNSFTPFSSAEKPLVLYNTSQFTYGAAGALLTDQRIYGKGFSYPWSKDHQIIYHPAGHLTINNSVHRIIPSAASKVPFLLSEMLRDLCEEDRVLIKANPETVVPQRCCACGSKKLVQKIKILKKARKAPHKSVGSKILGFAIDSFMLNLSPFAYMMKEIVGSGGESKQNKLGNADLLFLPFCSQCVPVDITTSTPLETIKISIGETVNVGLIKVKPEELWFELSLHDSKFALELKKANLNTVHKKLADIIGENQNVQNIKDFSLSQDLKTNEEIITNLFQVLTPRDRFYSVVPDIPDKKIKKASQLINKLNQSEKIIGLQISFTFTPIVFTTQGIYWKTENFGHVSYKDIKIKDIKLVSRDRDVNYLLMNSKTTSPFTFDKDIGRFSESPDWLIMFLKKVCVLLKNN